MPATVTTHIQQTGQFQAPIGAPIDNAFFREVFADRIDNNVYKMAYNCNILQECTLSTFLEEWGGVEYDCATDITLLEYSSLRWQIKISTSSTIPANPSTGTLKISANDHFVSSKYVLPRAGNSLIAPNGELLEVISMSKVDNEGDTDTEFTLVVKRRGNSSSSLTIAANQELLVVPGKRLEDCDCPDGQFRLPAPPIEHEFSMIRVADKGSLCDKALESCVIMSVPFLDANGNEITGKTPWYTGAQQEMYRGIERAKHYERLFNEKFGLIPVLKTRGTLWKPASSTEVTLEDIRDFKKAMNRAGVMRLEYAGFLGNELFSQFQKLAISADVKRIELNNRPLLDCKWVDLNYCGISVEGVTLHLYEDCSFSNGMELGANGMVFPNSGIWMPLDRRPIDVIRRGSLNRSGNTNKMYTTVYFQSIHGQKYDMFVDSNGILGPRNSFGTGCRKHEWSVESQFMGEVHCPERWAITGFGL